MPAREWRRGILAMPAAVALIAAAAPAAAPAAARGGDRFAYSIVVDGEVDPSTQSSLETGISDAIAKRAAVLIVRLNTPGGLAAVTRTMVEDIIAAPMPVIVYVHPAGGRAASAGLFLTLAGDVAAMAPATNIGSATPVRVGGAPLDEADQRRARDLDRKFLNDSVAFARTLAEDHRRNADLAERMIRDAVNVTAMRARRERLVDVIAPSEQALLPRSYRRWRRRRRAAERARQRG